MWLSGQQKRPPERDEGQTGTVTICEGGLAVQLDSERRGLEVYAPAGYRWTPQPGQQVLVLKNRGEVPCVIGARQEDKPAQVGIEADLIDLRGQVCVNGVPLESYLATLMAGMT